MKILEAGWKQFQSRVVMPTGTPGAWAALKSAFYSGARVTVSACVAKEPQLQDETQATADALTHVMTTLTAVFNEVNAHEDAARKK